MDYTIEGLLFVLCLYGIQYCICPHTNQKVCTDNNTSTPSSGTEKRDEQLAGVLPAAGEGRRPLTCAFVVFLLILKQASSAFFFWMTSGSVQSANRKKKFSFITGREIYTEQLLAGKFIQNRLQVCLLKRGEKEMTMHGLVITLAT